MSHIAAATLPCTWSMADLSPRQREILTLVAAGRTSKEIAGELGISESTVNWHISNVFGRLGASSRAEAVALAMREEIQRGEHEAKPPERRAARPPLPLSSVALAVGITLVLGLLGGALLAGWDFIPPTSPSTTAVPSSGASHKADLTAQPAGVLGPSPHPAVSLPAEPTPWPTGTPTPATIAPLIPAIAPPSLPVASSLPAATAVPTLPPLPSVPPLAPAPLTGR
jgi:DNA-binding CsgD family transcriptional regulator